MEAIHRYMPGIGCYLSDQNSLSDPKTVIWGERDCEMEKITLPFPSRGWQR